MDTDIYQSDSIKIEDGSYSRILVLPNQNGEVKFDQLHVDHVEMPKKVFEEHDLK